MKKTDYSQQKWDMEEGISRLKTAYRCLDMAYKIPMFLLQVSNCRLR